MSISTLILVEAALMSSHPSPGITGVILAGGQSRRMGRNKALMTLGGVRLIDRVVETMQHVCTDLLMVTNTPEVYADLRLPMVGDVWPDKGSLGGIYSALYHATTPYCLVVACDMPFLQTSVLQYLVSQIETYDVVMPEVDGEPQPLHAIYGRACLQPIAQRLEANRLKIVGFLPDVKVRTVTADKLRLLDPDLRAFQNLNTPEDMAAATRYLQA
jgi:molybdopterin-guanine dinucleotide biosynthesis protein A